MPAKFVFALLVFCVGCGNSGPVIHPAKGKLTKGGQPLAGVVVTFTPVGGGPSSSGLTNDSGAFELLSASGKAGAVAGKHKVTLAAQAAGAGSATTDWSKMAQQRDAATQGGQAGKPPEEKKDEKVPVEYTDPSKSPLPEYEVTKAGPNEFDIKIP
ncbi:MAG: carboxypeptidase regulatory-like domain-containing protein [Planctomycetia bacterium]|nr:carboxypeptidase regulatory-like domain-containing protein [Planctomycetia bacterium]